MRSYSYLMNGGGDGDYVELPEQKLIELLRMILVQVEVDEEWYCSVYRDVDTAIRSKAVPSARHHYITAGYFENRLPRPITVDEDWYLEEYPDVASAIQYGVFASATQHFERDGFKEGRLPSQNWSLLTSITRQLQNA